MQRVVAVIAGPGTGKTKTLVSRIAYLIEEQGVKPEEITAVTFTNQAATEMRQRLEQRLGGKSEMCIRDRYQSDSDNKNRPYIYFEINFYSNNIQYIS